MKALFFIAKRYFLFKKSSHIVNVISWISIISIATCTAALIIVSSVFNGIDELIKNMYNTYSADIKITPKNGKIIYLNDSLKHFLSNQQSSFQTTSYIITIDALIQKENTQFICKLQGVDSSFQNKKFNSTFLTKGTYLYPKNAMQANIVLSSSIAQAIGIDVEMNPAEISIYTAPLKLNSIQLEQELKVSYFFTIGEYIIHKDVDIKYCFAPYDKIQTLSGLDSNECTSIEIYANSAKGLNLVEIKKNIQELAPHQALNIENKMEQNKTLFAILNSEKLIIFVIFSFIIFIAAFNIAGTINLLMMEKQKQIFLLKTFGYSNQKIKKIFFYCGILYGISGLLIGEGLGLGICLLQAHFHLVPIQGNFIINYFPIKLELANFAICSFIVIFISLLATQYAIWKLGKQLKNASNIQELN